jgi:hypothetical protein
MSSQQKSPKKVPDHIKKVADLSEPKKCYICLGDEKDGMITLWSCKHSVHQSCVKGQLSAGWTGNRISFGFMSCGECRIPIFHRKLKKELAEHYKLKRRVEAICYSKCLEDNIFADLRAIARRNKAEAKAICVSKMSCFLCSTCDKPFCAGQVNCADDSEIDVSTLNCESCAFEVQQQALKKHAEDWRGKCLEHGYKFAMYKCDSCCAMATFDCRSNHYCARCHNNAYSEKNYPCSGPDTCPLGIDHPPNQGAVHGEDRGEFIAGFVVGCFRCFTQSEQEPDFNADPVWEARF